MGLEFELKFSASEETQAAIFAAMEKDCPFSALKMETTYYDTPNRSLSARHYTLRRRMENGESVCTIKTPAGALGRGEWEVAAETIEAAIPELCKLGCPKDLLLLTADGVQPVCGARFTRRCCTIQAEDCTLELALDSGVLLGGGREAPLREVEVELKSGSREAAITFANLLAKKYALQPMKKSKFRRALDLASEA